MKLDFNKLLEESVPDKTTRDYILEDFFTAGDNKPFNTVSNILVIFNNIINLSFIYAFSCIKTLANTYDVSTGKTKLDVCFETGNSNSKRVIRTLQQAYSKYYVSNELIQFVLTDIYFDFSLLENSLLRNYIPKCISVDNDIRLDDYFYIIKNLQHVDRLDGYTFKMVYDMLSRLLKVFNFLKHIKLSFSKEMGWYVFTFNEMDSQLRDIRIDTFGLIQRIKVDRYSRFFYLSTIEPNGRYIYQKIDGKKSVVCNARIDVTDNASMEEISEPFYLADDNETFLSYLQPDLLKTKAPVSVVQLDQLFNINYKYLKNLALALSDTLGVDDRFPIRDELTKKYQVQYPNFWSDCSDMDRNWDVIILMLLMEAGPSEVLTTILNGHNVGYSIISNLKKRLGSVFAKRVEDITSSWLLKQKAKARVQIVNKESIPENIYQLYEDRVIVQAEVRIILDALSNLDEDVEQNTISYTSIAKSIQCIDNLFDSTDKTKKCFYLKSMLRDMLERLLCFYAGIIGCAYEKICYDNESANTVLPKDRIQICQNAIQNKFISVANEELRNIRSRNLSTKDLIDYFFNVCNQFYSDSSDSYKKIVNLKAVLGRRQMLDVEMFKKECGISGLPEINEGNVDEWLKNAKKALCFLKTGDDDITVDCNFLKAVYPIVATYTMRNDNKDGCQTAVFSLEIDANNNGSADYQLDVKVLSEFDYLISEKYYCLPNIERSTKEWWFDPFVISCKEFDKIFERR